MSQEDDSDQFVLTLATVFPLQYFGYRFDCNDLDCEDYRSRAHMWAQTRYALEFFQDNNVPFWDMANSDSLIEGDNWCLKQSSDETIVVYLKNGGTTFVDFTDLTVAEYSVKWFNPRQGGALIDGDVTSISSDSSSIGLPPSDPSSDWVVLLTSSLF